MGMCLLKQTKKFSDCNVDVFWSEVKKSSDQRAQKLLQKGQNKWLFMENQKEVLLVDI